MALFKTTEQLREFFPAKLTFQIADLLPTLDRAEREYLADQVLGPELYATLHENFQEDTLPPELEELLQLCRAASANLALYHYTGLANVELASGGLVTGQSEHKRPAHEWRTRDFERAALSAGHRALDVLVDYLFVHADEFDEWSESTQYTRLTEGFTRTTAHYDQYVRIGNSGYLWTRLMPTVRRIEQGAVQDTLCSGAMRQQLLDAAGSDSPTDNNSKLLLLIREATAHLAMADAIVELGLNIDMRGVWTFNSLLGGQTSGGPMPAGTHQLQYRIDFHRNIGQHMLKRLQSELQRQAAADEDHPYRASACYVDPSADTSHTFNTDGPVAGFM